MPLDWALDLIEIDDVAQSWRAAEMRNADTAKRAREDGRHH